MLDAGRFRMGMWWLLHAWVHTHDGAVLLASGSRRCRRWRQKVSGCRKPTWSALLPSAPSQVTCPQTGTADTNGGSATTNIILTSSSSELWSGEGGGGAPTGISSKSDDTVHDGNRAILNQLACDRCVHDLFNGMASGAIRIHHNNRTTNIAAQFIRQTWKVQTTNNTITNSRPRALLEWRMRLKGASAHTPVVAALPFRGNNDAPDSTPAIEAKLWPTQSRQMCWKPSGVGYGLLLQNNEKQPGKGSNHAHLRACTQPGRQRGVRAEAGPSTHQHAEHNTQPPNR